MPINYQLGKVYTIVNSINGIQYVGSTAQPRLSRRWGGHREAADSENTPLYEAMRALGKDNFQIILHHAFPCNSKDELVAEEYKTMELLQKAGTELYNRQTGGAMAQETKDKIAAAKEGKPRDKETKDKLSKALKGKFRGDESVHFNYGSLYLKPATAKEDERWMFQYSIDGVRKSKSFNTKKLGFDEAKKMAEEERKRVFPAYQA